MEKIQRRKLKDALDSMIEAGATRAEIIYGVIDILYEAGLPITDIKLRLERVVDLQEGA